MITARQCVLGAATLAVSTGLALAFESVMQMGRPSLTLYLPAVFLATALSGRTCGLVVTVLSPLVAELVIPHTHASSRIVTAELTSLAIFSIVAVASAVLAGRLEDARRDAERAAADARKRSDDLIAAREQLGVLRRAAEQRARDFTTLFEEAPIGVGIAEDVACTRITPNRTLADMLGVPAGTNIAQAMKRAGGQVVLLTNALATRAAIERTWFDLVTRAKPGDTLVFSFAGHGSQEPQPPGWHEPNGKSDNFLLGGYTGTGPGARERIVDYEMYQWLKAADDKNVNVVFIADSCHSGTMFRSVGANPPRYRTGKFPDPTLAGDLLKLPDPALANVKEDDFKNVTFVGATQDHMVTPELTIGGEKRGALSWAFSRAIEGAADTNKDGQLSQQEMLAYIIPTVTTQSENQQVPSMLPLRADQRAIMRSVAGSATGPPRLSGPSVRDQAPQPLPAPLAAAGGQCPCDNRCRSRSTSRPPGACRTSAFPAPTDPWP